MKINKEFTREYADLQCQTTKFQKVAQRAVFWLDGRRRGLEKPELTPFSRHHFSCAKPWQNEPKTGIF